MSAIRYNGKNVKAPSSFPLKIYPGFLHFYHYNECHLSDYHLYIGTYNYTSREKFNLQFYHFCTCGKPRRHDTLASSQLAGVKCPSYP